MDRLEAELAQRIGRTVKNARTGLEWSQATLAERMNASVEFVSLIERGERLPALGTLVRLAKVLGVSAGSLLGEEKVAVEKDVLIALARAVPESAKPVVIGMLRGVIQAQRAGNRKR
jgi:transcriptional regulator with XRE-family HTH domain